MDNTIDYEDIWHAQVGTTLPAEVKRRQYVSGLTFVKLPIPLINRWGRREREMACRGEEHRNKRYVEVLVSNEDYKRDQSPFGEVLRQLDDKEYSHLRIKHDQHALQRAVDDLKAKAAAVEQQVQQLVDQELEQSRADIAAETKRLQDAQGEIPAIVEAEVQKKLGSEREKLAADRADVDALLTDAQDRLDQAETTEKRLEGLQEQAEQFRQQGGPEFMEILRRAEPEAVAPRATVDPTDPPTDLFAVSQAHLQDRGYATDEVTLARVVLAAVTAMATGQLVLLSGPTGVGKTSLVRRVAELLGAGPEVGGVVPVRPAWLDPADLVGFYNAAADRYEPTPFIDELVRAQRHAQAGEPTFLVLDEMNLARIENYGADLLALLEKSRENLRVGRDDTAALQLYAEATAARLDADLTRLVRRRAVTEEGPDADDLDARIADLRRQAAATPPRLPVPPGVVLFGTLNADETTHPLSPKVKDRAFVLQLPAPAFADAPTAHETAAVTPQWSLAHTFVSQIDADAELPSWATASWADLQSWHEPYLRPLGVHVSRRFAALFRFYTAAAARLGLPTGSVTTQHVVSGFLAAKLLPWITFHKDDTVRRGNETVAKTEVLDQWLAQLGEYPSLQAEVQAIIDGADLMYEYVR